MHIHFCSFCILQPPKLIVNIKHNRNIIIFFIFSLLINSNMYFYILFSIYKLNVALVLNEAVSTSLYSLLSFVVIKFIYFHFSFIAGT